MGKEEDVACFLVDSCASGMDAFGDMDGRSPGFSSVLASADLDVF